ncbi:Sodium/hydrogen exchanger family-domain-containing protein [Pyrenochaeta sp. MPI-SDFR-AT-0127]|nr:Sodium/hydrogen exchanger family-domain-containing protein [Pyrenochaeta sp. MPI-SDFR-AT-0127]
MSSVATRVASATAAAATTVSKAPPQAGIFEGLNPAKYNANNPIILFIIQAAIVIALCRALYWPLGKIRQPPVIAEVITGIILGPSIMGRITGFTDTIFPKESMAGFTLAANIGLIFYLFLVGLEIDLRFLVRNWRTAVSVASLDMAVPFALGYALAYGIYNQFKSEPNTVNINFATFGLFVAIAIAITAFPVLCRILTSLNLLNANVGVITLTSGIANDVLGWVLLALCVTLVNAGNGITALYVLLVAAGYALFLAFTLRPVFMMILRKTGSLENGPSQGVVALTVFMVLISAFFTDIIGAHSVFGAFMIGLMCPHEGGFAIKLTEKLEDIVAVLFLPLFFARSGLNTNLGLLDSGMTWGYVIAIIMVAFLSKIFGGTMGARLNGLVWRESLTIGVLMSCKGLVELIVLNIGLQAKILSVRTFTMFVVMALVTTFATTPIVSYLYPPAYQRKLELWKAGKIDWEGNQLHPDDDSENNLEKKLDVADRLLVYLRADGLSSLFSVINLFSSAASRQSNSSNSSTNLTPIPEKGLFTTNLRHSVDESSTEQTQRKRLRIHSLRLTELSERTSSVMRVSEPYEEYAGNDPIMKAFGSLANTTASRDVVISGHVSIAPADAFAETLISKASSTASDFILVPWSETGSLSELPSYFVGSAQRDPMVNRDFSRLVDDLFQSSKTTASIGVFIDRTLLRVSSSASATSQGISSAASTYDEHAVIYASDNGKTHLHVLYASSPDDLFAVKLALQLAQNPAVALSITKLSPHTFLSTEAAHINDTSFEDLRSHGATLTANKVTYNSISAATLPDNAFGDATKNTMFIIGRSIADLSALERIKSGDAGRTLGAATADVIGKVKTSGVGASVLVVQAREESGSGINVTPK